MDMLCIYCKKPRRDFSEEHVIPESLGGPKEFYLPKGMVCVSCNTGQLSRVDENLVRAFRPLLAFRGIQNKKGKHVESDMGNVVISYHKHSLDKIHVQMSMDREGECVIGNTDKGHEGYQFSWSPTNKPGWGHHVSRGLQKIAFNYCCYTLGQGVVLDTAFDDARGYILTGRNPGGRRWPLIVDSRTGQEPGAYQEDFSLMVERKDVDRVCDVYAFGIKFSLVMDGPGDALLERSRETNRRVGSDAIVRVDQNGVLRRP